MLQQSDTLVVVDERGSGRAGDRGLVAQQGLAFAAEARQVRASVDERVEVARRERQRGVATRHRFRRPLEHGERAGAVGERLDISWIEGDRLIVEDERLDGPLQLEQRAGETSVARRRMGGERERLDEAIQRFAIALEGAERDAPVDVNLGARRRRRCGLVVALERLIGAAESEQGVAAIVERFGAPGLVDRRLEQRSR